MNYTELSQARKSYLSKIEMEAYTLLEEYVKLSGRAIRVPIDVLVIAEVCYDFRIEFKPMAKAYSGQLYIKDKLIKINALDTPERQRFTIGHELAHLRLHAKTRKQLLLFDTCRNVAFVCQRKEKEKREREANTFAASLLMPRRLLTQAYINILTDEEVDPKLREYCLAKQFSVSLEAMHYRLINLGVINTSSYRAKTFNRL